MKVSALIAQLKKMPADLHVIMEGCDCAGPASGVKVNEPETREAYVFIMRDDDEDIGDPDFDILGIDLVDRV